MVILQTPADPTRPPGGDEFPPTYLNTETHWWDGSQLYGSTLEHAELLRSGVDGKLRIRATGCCRPRRTRSTTRRRCRASGSGSAMMQMLFTREHNAICDRLQAEYPTWTDDELFQRARLVIAALIAKIHTVEWTPAVISHPTTAIGAAGQLVRPGRRAAPEPLRADQTSEIISGIPGSDTEPLRRPVLPHRGVRRRLPDAPADSRRLLLPLGRRRQRAGRGDLPGPRGPERAKSWTSRDGGPALLLRHAASRRVGLHNFPRFLQEFLRPDGKLKDLAATDILRTRELGVPRYNEFRRLLHLKPAATSRT